MQGATVIQRSSQFLARSPPPPSITWSLALTTSSLSMLWLVEETAPHPALRSTSHTRRVHTHRNIHTQHRKKCPICSDSASWCVHQSLSSIFPCCSLSCWLSVWNGGDGCERQQCDSEVEPHSRPYQRLQSDWGPQEWTGSIFHWGGCSRYGVWPHNLNILCCQYFKDCWGLHLNTNVFLPRFHLIVFLFVFSRPDRDYFLRTDACSRVCFECLRAWPRWRELSSGSECFNK